MRSLKELASLGRDRVLAAFIVYSFSLSVYSQATGIKTDVANAPIAIVDSDQSALSARIHDGLLKPYFRRPDAIDRSIVDRTMDVGNYAFVLDVPSRLEADLLRGRSPTIQLNIDATAMTQAAVGGGYVESIVRQEPAGFLQSRGIAALCDAPGTYVFQD
jgi:ABC-2 type transport system permease protein